jgi:hypothetical protein
MTGPIHHLQHFGAAHPMAKAMLNARTEASKIMRCNLYRMFPIFVSNETAGRHGSMSGTRHAFIHVTERRPRAHVSGIKPLDVKSPSHDKVIDLAVEMTSSLETLQIRRKAILPARDPALWHLPVLHKKHAAVRPQHTPHFAKRCQHIRDRA